MPPPAGSFPAARSASSWQLPGFDDSAWNGASTGIGYGYDSLTGEGGDTRNAMWFVSPGAYIRIPFVVEDPGGITSLALDMRFDDGFVAYLNGVRVASSNAPDAAAITFGSNATAQHPGDPASGAESFPVSAAALAPGANVLGIHGLNFSSSGTDSADFLALPELTATSSDAGGALGYFSEPTPRASNGATPLLGFVADTKFSHDRGYFSAPFELTITTATPGATIIYTLDGTPPSADNGAPLQRSHSHQFHDDLARLREYGRVPSRPTSTPRLTSSSTTSSASSAQPATHPAGRGPR